MGPFYPKVLPSVHWLSFYLGRFPMAEVNATHYVLPSAQTVSHWVTELGRARGWWDAPQLALKAPRGLTHENRSAATVREEAERFWARCGEPLAAEGCLGGVLLQYPPWLPEVPSKPARRLEALESGEAYASLVERLEAAAQALQGGRLAVELRNKVGLHPETNEPPPAFLQLLRRLGATLVTVDGPPFPALHVATSREAYVRLHGRNATAWAEGDEDADPSDGEAPPGAMGRAGGPGVPGPSDRYDYLYSDAELEGWARRIREMAPRLDVVRVLFNNHPTGKAAANATRMMELLALPGPRPHGGQHLPTES